MGLGAHSADAGHDSFLRLRRGYGRSRDVADSRGREGPAGTLEDSRSARDLEGRRRGDPGVDGTHENGEGAVRHRAATAGSACFTSGVAEHARLVYVRAYP